MHPQVAISASKLYCQIDDTMKTLTAVAGFVSQELKVSKKSPDRVRKVAGQMDVRLNNFERGGVVV